MADGEKSDRKQSRSSSSEDDISSGEERKRDTHLQRKHTSEDESGSSRRETRKENRSRSRRNLSVNSEDDRNSDEKPRNEKDYDGRHRSDDKKPQRDRHERDARDKSVEHGMVSDEEKGNGKHSRSRRDENVSGRRRQRSDYDDEEEYKNEARKKQAGKLDLSRTAGRSEETEGKDHANDRPSRDREPRRRTEVDYDRKRYSQNESDRGRDGYPDYDRKRHSQDETDRRKDRNRDHERKRHSQDETDRVKTRYHDRDRKTHSQEESHRGRGRYEGDERYEQRRRRYSDDGRERDNSGRKREGEGEKIEEDYRKSHRHRDNDAYDGREEHDEKLRSKFSQKDSNVGMDRDQSEQHDGQASRSKAKDTGGGNTAAELLNTKRNSVPTQNGEVASKEKAVGRSGGVYIPPFKLAQMMKDVQDKSSLEYQRMTWDALRKSINGLVNKVNASNIKNIIPELFAENLIRGRGLFCRSCMKSQMASPGFTDVFAALVAVVNTKFPEVGNLLLRRIILQLKRAFKRNDKHVLLAAAKFVAHLVNQQVAHEIIALELLTVLLENPTDDSVEVAVGFVKECGSLLQDLSPQGLYGIFERFRGILHEGEIDKRVQFLIEGLFAIRKAKFQGFPAVRPELDLVEQEDQFTHEFSLEDELDQEVGLDIFKPDPEFLEHEKAYENLKKDIIGEESSDEAEGENDSEEGSDDDDDEEEEDEEMLRIKDETETNLVNLRRTIYLTIMSSVDFEEAGHKLLKIKLEPGQEMELCIMLLECCSQERTYLRYYGLLGQRFCMINKIYQEFFDKCFVQQYSMIHRLETNKLRNVAKFFAHLLGTDALPWHALAYIRLTEEDTTSSSRIFIKILFQELAEQLGIRMLNERLNDPTMQDSFDSIFPKDNPKNSRFAINFFTSIGLGGITESLREYLKNMPRLIMQQQKPISESDTSSSSEDESNSSTGSSESDSSDSESESGSETKKKKRREKRVSSDSESESESESERKKRKKSRRN